MVILSRGERRGGLRCDFPARRRPPVFEGGQYGNAPDDTDTLKWWEALLPYMGTDRETQKVRDEIFRELADEFACSEQDILYLYQRRPLIKALIDRNIMHRKE